MIRAVIFDMDGVIVDTGIVHNIAEQTVLDEIGVHLTMDEIRHYAGQPAEIWFKEALKKNNKSADIEKLVDRKHDMMYKMLEHDTPIIPG